MKHSQEIVDQFTRQAEQFAQSSTARNEEILERILRMARPERDDDALDIACGPGLVVCALAPLIRYATGIDLTPAMLETARRTQQERDLANISWDHGDVTALPYGDACFNIVTCRFAFHHFPDPLAVLREMRRVTRPGGRIVVADTSPEAEKADAFNSMERMRDPSHARALPGEELRGLFAAAGMPEVQVERIRLALDLESFLARSYPKDGDKTLVRALFDRAVTDDFMDVQARRGRKNVHFSIPVAIVGAHVH